MWNMLDQTGLRRASNPDRIWTEMFFFYNKFKSTIDFKTEVGIIYLITNQSESQIKKMAIVELFHWKLIMGI